MEAIEGYDEAIRQISDGIMKLVDGGASEDWAQSTAYAIWLRMYEDRKNTSLNITTSFCPCKVIGPGLMPSANTEYSATWACSQPNSEQPINK